MVSVAWAPHVKYTWADCLNPIIDVSGLSGHGHKQGKLYGPHIVSETWVSHRDGLAIGSTGIFPGGPINNFLFVYLFFAVPCDGNSPGPGAETWPGPQSYTAACRHSRGPLVCLSKEYLAKWPYDRLQRPRNPTHTCSRPPLVQSPLTTTKQS